MGTDKITSDMAAEKIAGIDADLAKADGWIAHYTEQKNALLALKKALLPLVSEKLKKPNAKTLSARNRIDAAGNAAASVTSQKPRRATSTGFRDAIRSALAENPKGLKPSEVHEIMERKGDLSKYNGVVPITTRIHNELYTLKKRKMVTRRNGKYALVQTVSEPPSMAVN